MKIVTHIKLLLLSLFIGWGSCAFAVIVVDSTRTTASNCANDGTITIYAKSPSSMLFAIVSGPDIRPPQNGNQFGALPSGAYQVMVTNFSNDTAYATATINSNYAFPDFATTFTDPICPGSSTGVIFCHAVYGTGRPPYTWVLTEIATGVVTTQTSDTFPNLSAGDYSIRMYDSCQAFATRFVTLSNHYNSLQARYVWHNFIACNTDVLTIVLESNTGTWSPPFVVTTYWGAGNVRIDTFNPLVFAGSTVLYLYDTVVGMNYGDGAGASITDACGNMTGWGSQSDVWDPQAAVYPILDSCQVKYRPGFVLTSSFPPTTAFHTPVYFQVWDSLTGATIDSIVLSPGSAYYSPSYFLQPNRWYKMRVYDSCGHYTVKYFTTPVPDTTQVFVSKNSNSCIDSTAIVDIHCINYSTTSTRLTILSGPTIARSSTPRFAHRDTITYPISNFLSGTCSAYYGNDICFTVVGLPVGAYTYRVEDSCGHSRTDTFTIRNEDLAVYGFDDVVIKGCPGQNKIKYQLKHSPYNFVQDFFRLYPINSTNAIDSLMSDSAVFSNLNAGTYRIFHRPNYYVPSTNFISNVMQCFAINDTIVVPLYQIPRIDYATQIKCNGTVNVGLQPDSSTGVPPYLYEIISGPLTEAVQASQFFTLMQQGSYVARISDTCGFARTFSFYVDTLSFQQIVKVGSSCLGNTATLVCQHSPYATYVWQKPNGSLFIGDSLFISPITPSDYGVYHIKKIVSVNNCSDTFYTTYNLVSSAITNLYDTICEGNSISLGTKTYTKSGAYSDTFSTIGCDSIRTFNLTVKVAKRDSFSLSICNGQSYSVGLKNYTTTGIYRDTFSTSNCDSVRILNLKVSSSKIDSISMSVCAGQIVSVGYRTYTTSGIYRDTFPTFNCDSVRILNLTINAIKKDSISVSICNGQSIIVGSKNYTSSGIYRDTFPTINCDSIHILNLIVTSIKRDSITQTICTGQNVIVGSHTYNSTGIYRDTFSTINCDSIYVLNLKVVTAKRDTIFETICAGQSIVLGTKNYSTAGIYRDTFVTPNCDSIRVLNLTVKNAKLDTILQSICEGHSINLGGKNYSSSGIYIDTFSTINCDSIRILNLYMLPAKRDTVNVRFCEGESVIIDSKKFTVAGFFTDTFTTVGCDSLHTIHVVTFAKPIIQISASNEVVEKGDTIQLNMSNDFSYQWTSSGILSNPLIQNPTAIISESSWVMVHATDANNCKAFDSLFITVKDCEGTIYVPNAFTPNGDESNDGYRIFGKCIKLNRFMIFNRWGEKVWETNNIEQEWNGYYKSVLQPTGVYVYWLSYSLGDEKVRELKGSITLIR